ncbi:hypothetical protein [Agriterribacter sp.]|uniref:hypothetical protein n=1 Tax=Agriterribacter sp. TaxID=2821509 RepID=UPI002D02F664|nr:hypothetical protein [Agriterribacter sp.]HTN08856.1 hypothetical protein [Agriterribacter sp.]
MKTRAEKLSWIRKVKEDGITENELFFASLKLDKCTTDELNWILSVLKNTGKQSFTIDSITEEHKSAFEQFKLNYNARNPKKQE